MPKGLFTLINCWMWFLFPWAAPGLGSRPSSDPVFRHRGAFSSLEVSGKLQVRELECVCGGVVIVLFKIRSLKGKKKKSTFGDGRGKGRMVDGAVPEALNPPVCSRAPALWFLASPAFEAFFKPFSDWRRWSPPRELPGRGRRVPAPGDAGGATGWTMGLEPRGKRGSEGRLGAGRILLWQGCSSREGKPSPPCSNCETEKKKPPQPRLPKKLPLSCRAPCSDFEENQAKSGLEAPSPAISSARRLVLRETMPFDQSGRESRVVEGHKCA